MLIKEEYVKPSLLDKISYLEEQPLSEATIPVTENSRLGKYVVSLEDINSYCEETTSDPGYVISQICDINGIPVDDIAFSVTQESIILGENVAENAIYLMNEGAEVLAKPVVHDALYDFIEEECQKAVYDNKSLDEVSQDFVNKMLGVDSVPDVQIGKSFIIGGPNKEYNGTANRNTVRMAVAKSRHSPYPYADSTFADLMANGAKVEDNKRKSNKIRNKWKREKRQKDEDKAWNMHDYGTQYYDDFTWQKDLDMNKGFRQINKEKSSLDKENEKYQLRNEINNGMDAIYDMNLKDEQDRQEAQLELQHRLRTEKRIKKNEELVKEVEEHNKKVAEINKQTKTAMRSNNRGFIAKVIARLNSIARKYREKYKNIKVSGPKTAIQKILGFIAKCVASLTAKLHSLHRRFR